MSLIRVDLVDTTSKIDVDLMQKELVCANGWMASGSSNFVQIMLDRTDVSCYKRTQGRFGSRKEHPIPDAAELRSSVIRCSRSNHGSGPPRTFEARGLASVPRRAVGALTIYRPPSGRLSGDVGESGSPGDGEWQPRPPAGSWWRVR